MNKLFILILILISNYIYSQEQKDLKFIEFLISREEYKAAIQCLNDSQLSFENDKDNYKDSINFLKGWSYYCQKDLNNSIKYLSQVNNYSSLYSKSILFATYNSLHLSMYNETSRLLNDFKCTSQKDSIVSNLLYCGMFLLNRDLINYNTYRSNLDTNYYGIKKELKSLDLIYKDISEQKHKSPTLAGIMSAIIPGSGKIYLGKTGHGISSMLLVTGLGLVTFENIRKNGPENFSSIFFATTFATFYAGNIYGTIKLASLTNKEFNKFQDAKILFNIHIPLRNLYN